MGIKKYIVNHICKLSGISIKQLYLISHTYVVSTTIISNEGAIPVNSIDMA